MNPLQSESDLATRKLLLQQRSAVLRELLSVQLSQATAPVFEMTDRFQAGGQWVKRHPAWVVGVGVAILAWKPRLMLRLATRGWGVWQTWRRFQPLVSQWFQRAAQASSTNTTTTTDSRPASEYEPPVKG